MITVAGPSVLPASSPRYDKRGNRLAIRTYLKRRVTYLCVSRYLLIGGDQLRVIVIIRLGRAPG